MRFFVATNRSLHLSVTNVYRRPHAKEEAVKNDAKLLYEEYQSLKPLLAFYFVFTFVLIVAMIPVHLISTLAESWGLLSYKIRGG